AANVYDNDLDDPPNYMSDSYGNFTSAINTGSGNCGDPATLISTVQGVGDGGSMNGTDDVVIEGIVVGDYQDWGTPDYMRGFFVMEEPADQDANPLTSEGIFIYEGSGTTDVSEGDIVRVQGDVTEYNNLTEMYDDSITVCSSGNPMVPVAVTIPVPNPQDAVDFWEPYEGMLVTITNTLTVAENYNLARYGSVTLSSAGRQSQYTQVNSPSTSGYPAYLDQVARDRIVLDDYRGDQNPDPLIHPNPELTAANTLRSGTTITGMTGVVYQNTGWDNYYRIQPRRTLPVTGWVDSNPRTTAPANVGGTLTVASFNVLNYFTTIDSGPDICGPGGNLDCRGADSTTEFQRQYDKLVPAIVAMDADVVGLMEIENNATASLDDLVTRLNGVAGPGTYAYINTGTIGTDAIKVGIIYQPASVTPVGSPAILDSSVDPLFVDTLNRPALAQTFMENSSGETFTVVVNHLKSKNDSGTPTGGDLDQGDGASYYNETRTNAATALGNWLATDPTGSGDPDFLIIGDLNAYAMETPITTLTGMGFSNLVPTSGYSYVYDGMTGNMDHALASSSMAAQVTGVTEWHINTDEPRALDYNLEYKSTGQQTTFYNADAYRASDHDPIVIGLSLGSAPPDGDDDDDDDSDGGDGSSDDASISIFDPAISKIGELPAGGLGLPGEQLVWHVFVSNTGSGTGTNVVISDTLRSELRVDSADTPRGTVSINGQTVTFTIPNIAPGETLELLITTTVISSPADGQFTNVATLNGTGADGVTVTESATGVLQGTSRLPATGYPQDDDSTSLWWLWAALGALMLVVLGAGSWLLRRKNA
ncbi:MAG: ExeM/NucH family extracellular endonuclease, partial [Chloroflexi bacterium]|nr:ExeM/NucH family extracellular endonuclease [Chloroflexota bacterium]